MHGVETVLNVLGSVTLLLWGVRMVRTGLTRAFGAALRRGIAACSRNRFTAFAGGLGITGLLQSSTATALLVASFARRGLIALSIALSSPVLRVLPSGAGGRATPPLALALVIGGNGGGALAPYMAQSGSDVAARRVPLGNLIPRLVTGGALLAVIGPAVHWLSFIDP